ncbi:MAG: Crp/Fnr family transcriptional regulator, partial [Salibacteraceae bacterium]
MSNPIFEFLAQYIELTAAEKEIITRQNIIRSLKKGSILLREGQVAQECFFILKGCVYSYYLVNGGLKVSEFYTEAQPITPVSYTTKAPSGYYLECAEDCVLAIGTPERTAELLQQLPRLAAMAGTMFQDQLATQR